MKLRIKGNSLRLRLTQSEVKKFQEEGFVEETIQFGATAATEMKYLIQQVDQERMEVIYELNQICLCVPRKIAEQWTTTNEVGFKHKILIKEDSYLSILVEKDFKCLQTREGEDEGDMFPNPEEDSLKC